MQSKSNYRSRFVRFRTAGPRRSLHPSHQWIRRSFTTTPIAHENWEGCFHLPAERLIAARGQLHLAAQLVTAAGISYLEPAADDSHTSMIWDGHHHTMVGQPLRSFPDLRVGLRPADLTLVFIEYGQIAGSIHLNGVTFPEAAELLSHRLNKHGFASSRFTLKRHYELPAYPSRDSTPFDASDVESFSTYTHLYGNTRIALERALQGVEQAAPIRIWPHHFDLASLIQLDQTAGRSIGMGISPGDDGYPEPYLYATPWPYPDLQEADLPGIPEPYKWHTRGWTGMVLHYRDLCISDEPQRLLARFFRLGKKVNTDLLS